MIQNMVTMEILKYTFEKIELEVNINNVNSNVCFSG